MDFVNWINKNIKDIRENILYQRYFESILMEKGIDGYSLFNQSLGIDLILTEKFDVKAIHFFSGKEKDVSRFKDKLPFNLDFIYSRNEIREILGTPSKSGGGDFSFLYGTTPPWDKYIYDKIYLHLQFSESHNEIVLITIGRC